MLTASLRDYKAKPARVRRPTSPCSRRRCASNKIGRFLKAGFGSTAFPIYVCGAAERKTLGASHAMRILLFIVLAAVAVGWSGTSRPQSATSSGALDEARVLAIARAAVATNDTWLDRAEFDKPIRRPDGSWSVIVWRLPAQAGGHRSIRIDPEGKVTQYVRGL